MSEESDVTDVEVDVISLDSPWHGIPVELLDGTYSYDLDTAGGCG